MSKQKNGEKLATLIHISDLHFRSVFKNDKTWFDNIQNFPIIRGRLGHDYQTAVALSNKIYDILQECKGNIKESEINILKGYKDVEKNKKRPAAIIFSGDLTCAEDEKQVKVGKKYLRGKLSIGKKRKVGLNLGRDRNVISEASPGLLFVPGNHDTHGLSEMETVNAYRKAFPGTFPMLWKINTGKETKQIYFYGLDSTHNNYPMHKFARGKVEKDQMTDLETEIKSNKKIPNSIHIVFLHHPLTEPIKNAWMPQLKLDSRKNIAKKLREIGVDLVLSGHYHYNQFKPSNDDFPNHSIVGTGTQMFSEKRSFSVIDIFENIIYINAWIYNEVKQQFVLDENEEVSFDI